MGDACRRCGQTLLGTGITAQAVVDVFTATVNGRPSPAQRGKNDPAGFP
jgi:hypothetical protein